MILTKCCPVCDSINSKLLREYTFEYPGDEPEKHLTDSRYVRLHILFKKMLQSTSPATFQMMRCEQCGMLYLNPRCTEQDVLAKYTTLNELGSVKRRLDLRPPVRQAKRATRIRRLINRYWHNDPSRPKPRMLDYGGAAGYNSAPFAEHFDVGILDYERWNLPAGLTYLGKDLSDLGSNDLFDVILLLHTLEHITEPTLFLKKMCRHLKDDGILYVEVPLGAFREWDQVREPITHVNFFSEQSLAACCEILGLKRVHLSSRYQLALYGPYWCLNLIGAGPSYSGAATRRKPLPVEQQMKALRYYMPYFLDWKSMRRRLRRLLSKGL